LKPSTRQENALNPNNGSPHINQANKFEPFT
jgi:hypothetical protein